MAVAIVALIVALGGTATAPFGPFKGDKIIKKKSLSGNRLKNNTITGKQVNLSKLGKVPNASNADNANLLGGQPAGTLAPARRLVGTGAVKVTAATAPGHAVTVLQSGPFTVTGTCTDLGGGDFQAQMHITSTEANSVLDNTLHPTAGTPEDLETNTNTVLGVSDDQLSAQAPSGASLNLQSIVTEHGVSDCTFDLEGVNH